MQKYVTEIELVFIKPSPTETRCASQGPKKVVENSCAKPASSSCDKSAEEPSCQMAAQSPCGNSCESDPHDESLGMITRNPFFNFLRDYRKCHKNVSAKVIAVDGAAEWNGMSEQSKSKYIVQAFHTPKKYYRSAKNSSIGIN